MTPSDLPAVLHAMRQLLDEDRATYSSESDEHRLLVATANALPALLEYAESVLERHQVTFRYFADEPDSICSYCSNRYQDEDWPCPEIDSLCAALEPYSTLLAEEKANGDL